MPWPPKPSRGGRHGRGRCCGGPVGGGPAGAVGRGTGRASSPLTSGAASWPRGRLSRARGPQRLAPAGGDRGRARGRAAEGRPWLFERFGRSLEADPTADLVVVAGRWGSGGQHVAAALAQHARDAGLRAVLVDLDPLGGGLDLMLGAETATGARWDELAGITGRVETGSWWMPSPVADGSRCSAGRLTRPRARAAAVGQVLDALCRQRVSWSSMVVARRTAAAVALAKGRRLVLVVPLRVRAVAAARRTLRGSRRMCRHCSSPASPPGGLSPGRPGGGAGVPVAATLPTTDGARHRGGRRSATGVVVVAPGVCALSTRSGSGGLSVSIPMRSAARCCWTPAGGRRVRPRRRARDRTRGRDRAQRLTSTLSADLQGTVRLNPCSLIRR